MAHINSVETMLFPPHKERSMQMQNERKKLEELNLLDDFLFNAMMTYPEMGEKFTRKILKLLFNKEFRNLKVIAQKSYGGLNTDFRRGSAFIMLS